MSIGLKWANHLFRCFHCVKSVHIGVFLVHIQSECRIRTRKTSNMNTFYAVFIFCTECVSSAFSRYSPTKWNIVNHLHLSLFSLFSLFSAKNLKKTRIYPSFKWCLWSVFQKNQFTNSILWVTSHLYSP